MRINQKPQNQEHADLHNPGQGILKVDEVAAVEKSVISHDDAGNIYGEKAVAVDELRQAECQQNGTDAEYRIEAGIDQCPAAQHIAGQPAETVTGSQPHGHLPDKVFKHVGNTEVGNGQKMYGAH